MSRTFKNNSSDDEIDLKQVFGILKQGKKIIASITASTLVFGSLYLLIKKPIYEGQFQIVLKSSGSNSGTLSQMAKLGAVSDKIPAGILQGSGLNTDLFTEIGILKSPLLLMSIFNEVKEYKIKNGENLENLKFKDWLDDNLTIELERGTAILNLAYRDSDINLIIPTLNKISEKYQTYSSRDIKRSINQGINYLSNEIEKYEIISKNSAKELQTFALAQDLPTQYITSKTIGNSLQMGFEDKDVQSLPLDTETIRLNSINTIRLIDQKLEQLNDDKKSQENTILIGSTIPELRTTFLPQRLEKIDRELAIYRPKFTERDPIIRNLELQRVSIINLMNETTKDYLKVKRKDALANLNAAKRGEDIIFLYNELQKKASMDDITLVNLKNELRLLELEKTRYLNPWELITKPTLLDKPVSPDKKRVIGLSFILGLISGSFYVLLRKNNKERI